MAARRFQRRDGRYGLTAEPDEHGYFHLIGNVGSRYEYDAGLVADPENFEIAVDTAEEEMASLMAEAREEFRF